MAHPSRSGTRLERRCGRCGQAGASPLVDEHHSLAHGISPVPSALKTGPRGSPAQTVRHEAVGRTDGSAKHWSDSFHSLCQQHGFCLGLWLSNLLSSSPSPASLAMPGGCQTAFRTHSCSAELSQTPGSCCSYLRSLTGSLGMRRDSDIRAHFYSQSLMSCHDPFCSK